jgi:trehalose synthase
LIYPHPIKKSGDYKKTLSLKQSVIYPAIDPLANKNRPMSKQEIKKYLACVGIKLNRPIIAQISRFDKWKDPEGVIKVFELVKRQVDCQLVLLGNLAMDDPEGVIVHEKVINDYGQRKDIKILINVDNNDCVVNALQRASSIIIQKSLKEGFGLTVAEALYKATPVVASNIGGIPLQLTSGEHGFLHNPTDYQAFSESIIRILKDKKLRQELGQKGHEYIKNNFLITRLMSDWLKIFEKYLK